MATITGFKFETADGAGKMVDLLKDLDKQQLIVLDDAATVTWEKGKKKPKTKQLISLAGMGALNGAFWGMLFGLIFFIPFFGMAVGAAIGALAGKFSDYGIDDDFIKSVGAKVTEGTSALFLVTSDATEDKVNETKKEHKFQILTTNLSKEQEDVLCRAFSEEE